MKLWIYQNKNGIDLFISVPLQLFGEDCTNCINLNTSIMAFPSGKCNKHDFICGLGFTCKDYEKRR